MSDLKTEITIEDVLGPRPSHYHGGEGDRGCFAVCPVWNYDQQVRKLQAFEAEKVVDWLVWSLGGATEEGAISINKMIDEFTAKRAKSLS